MEQEDAVYMRRALALAQKGMGFTAPNPLVGAVIVKNGQVIGEGWHQKYGQAHAERNALAACTQSPAGATLYVTLEPCCHQGKQPPCTQAILEAGIARVVIGSADPNPLVAGKGAAVLKAHGVAVTEGVCRKDCDRLNEPFFHYITTQTPYVAMKYAMTLDGKIAAATGASQWVTGEEARAHVQTLRLRYSAVMVGVGTVLADNPRLTCRLPGGRNPIRIVCDSRLRTPLDAYVVQTAGKIPTWIATCCTEKARRKPYEDLGCRLFTVAEQDCRVDLRDLMAQLGAAGVDSILLEGGGALNWSALAAGVVQLVLAYVAPKIFGGREAKTPVEGPGVAVPAEAAPLAVRRITRLGEDILIESEVAPHVYRDR